jgi:hypothetical protein
MAAPGGTVPILVDPTVCVAAGSLVDRYDYDYGAQEMPNEGPLSSSCPIRTCPADTWSASGQDADGSAGNCTACPAGSGIADRGGVRTNNTAAHASAERCVTGDASVVVSAAGVPVCALGFLGEPLFSTAAGWSACAKPPHPPLPPAGASVVSMLSLAGIALGSFDAAAVAEVMAAAMGVQPGAVTVTVQSFALSTTLSLAGGAASLTPTQQAAIVSSVAASLPGVSPVQVSLSAAQVAAHRLRHLLQAPLQVGITVSGLPSDAAAAARTAVLLTAPATLSALVTSVAGTGITGATAAPVAVAVQLAIAVQVPTSGSSGAVAAALSASGGASLASALQSAGMNVTGVSVLAAPLVAAPPPPPRRPGPPDIRDRIIGGVIGGVLGAALLVAVIVLVTRHLNAVAGSTTDTTDDIKGVQVDSMGSGDAAAVEDGGGAWRTFLSSADEIVLGDCIGKGGYAVVHNATWRGTQVAVKIFDTGLRLRLGGVTSVGGVTGSSVTGSASSSRSYVREVALLSSLRHPNILAIYALVEAPAAMLVVELGAAGSLRDLLFRTSLQNVTWGRRVVVATGVACGVDFLHSQKPPIIHFDLKSANVVLDMALVPKARAHQSGASMHEMERCLTRLLLVCRARCRCVTLA